jgi:hypothetical protein
VASGGGPAAETERAEPPPSAPTSRSRVDRRGVEGRHSSHVTRHADAEDTAVVQRAAPFARLRESRPRRQMPGRTRPERRRVRRSQLRSAWQGQSRVSDAGRTCSRAPDSLRPPALLSLGRGLARGLGGSSTAQNPEPLDAKGAGFRAIRSEERAGGSPCCIHPAWRAARTAARARTSWRLTVSQLTSS